MKNKFFKRVMSLVLVVVMAVSTMAVSAFSASAATYTYRLVIKTGTESGAGTDADVYVHLYNGNGTRFKKQYINPNGDSFENGDTDYVTITTSQPIKNIKLSTLADFFDSWCGDWYVDSVIAEQLEGEKVVQSTKYIFEKWVECGNYEGVTPNPGSSTGGVHYDQEEFITGPDRFEIVS